MSDTAAPVAPHGDIRRYRAGCRCAECRAANAAYMRERRAAESAAGRAALAEAAALAGEDPGIFDGAAAGPAWWDQITARRAAAGRAEHLGAREYADPADGGQNCPACGEPMRWAGGYTALVCLAHDGRPQWRRDMLAAGRAAEYLAAIAAKAGTRIPPAEAADVAEARAVAADRIAGQLSELDRIPHGDQWRPESARARHHLGKLAERYDAARTYDDVEDAEDAEGELAERFAAVAAYAGQLARQRRAAGNGAAPKRRGLIQLIRGDGYEYDDDDDYPDPDSDQAPAEVPAALPMARPAAYPATWQPAAAAAVARLASNPLAAWDTAAAARGRAARSPRYGAHLIPSYPPAAPPQNGERQQ